MTGITIGLLFILLGVIVIFVIYIWRDAFKEFTQVQMFYKFLGERNATIFYILLGVTCNYVWNLVYDRSTLLREVG